MKIYAKDKIEIKIDEASMSIRDFLNAGCISCPLNNVSNLLEGLSRIKKDPSDYQYQNCLRGETFFPTIGCRGNCIILTRIPRIIKAIKSSSKISFKLNELHNLSLEKLNNINIYLKNNNSIIKDNDSIDIIFYNI